ncbi:LysR family transcriptional regulator [Vibrio sp. 10N.286.49.C2]|uniref:LysR family transcriptional regulator n=1 Tax=unclassified Vibrio TaxID=2614977 RepID=UPI000C863BE0|nr:MULTISPECIES: LysR family transcriptional regulator [unclassified Vibrio]PMH43394.1 LysR family transcriptional regulator [Vibrio sp. 10N.286.49.C2]PMH57046.1 LysR family transcriptional regulator [Vibrio sp. 10N.286.49.B1]PMH78526.1 LysR family transcriptional regulator [Vibrio sp. 10N.286.48.B7]
MYSFEQLKVFVTVCESGSFSAAARKLKRAQSGVSQAISNLEIAINQDLFNRDKNTPTLTTSGQALLPIARSILNQQTYFDQKAESLTKAYEHEVVIAVDESLISDDFFNILTPLAEQFPITHFEVITASTFDVESLVRSGKAQVGIVYSDGELKVDMDFFIVGHAKFLTIASPQHELAMLPIVQDSDLKRHRQCVHRSIQQKELWFSYGISSTFWYANTHQTLIDLVQQGIGWAVVPELLIKNQLQTKTLVSLPVAHEFNGWLTAVGCLVSRSHSSGPVLESVVERLKQHRFNEEHWMPENRKL